MAVRVSIARDSALLDELFHVRHAVFAGGNYMPARPDGRIVAHFDALPSCTQLVAVADRRVVGGLRLDGPSPVGSAADELYDFGWAESHPETTAGTSMLCLLPAYRGHSGINRALWSMAIYAASLSGITHLKGSANPEQRGMFESLGFDVLAEPFHHEESGLDVMPIMLELRRASDRVREFMRRQQLGMFEEAFDRVFVPAGETIIAQGDPGEEAYVLASGDAHTILPNGRRCLLAPGHLFGEVALLTDLPRTASVIAQTDVELMALHRDRFHEEIRRRPDAAISVLRDLALRLAADSGTIER